MRMYILDDEGNPVPVDDAQAWGAWLESADLQVCRDMTPCGADVSTAFLGIDHRFFGGGPPILWETMVFGGPLDGEQRRYSSRDEALAGHVEVTAMAIQAEARRELPGPEPDVEARLDIELLDLVEREIGKV